MALGKHDEVGEILPSHGTEPNIQRRLLRPGRMVLHAGDPFFTHRVLKTIRRAQPSWPALKARLQSGVRVGLFRIPASAGLDSR